MSYFISPPDTTDWSVDVDEFERRLRARWPDVEVRPVTDPDSIHQLRWTMQIDDYPLEGTLDRRGQVVNLDGDVRASAAFAVWFRTVTDDRQPLIFWDDGYSADVEVHSDSQAADIAAPYLN